MALWSSGHVCQRFLTFDSFLSVLRTDASSTSAVVEVGCTTPLSKFVVPMLVVLVLILLIITLVVFVVVLLKLLFELRMFVAVDVDWPLASELVLTAPCVDCNVCPLLSTTDGGGFGESIGDSCIKRLK
jgi:hypothetical protein